MPRDSKNFELADSSVTEALGRSLGRSLPTGVPAAPGSTGAVLYLTGDLGAGKTTCARSLLRSLGVAGLVRSPTYTLVEIYNLSALTCVHVDLYRVEALAEIEELGLRDVAGPGCLLLVEWPERGGAAVPPADLILRLRYAGDARHAAISAPTSVGREWLSHLGSDTSLIPYVSNST